MFLHNDTDGAQHALRVLGTCIGSPSTGWATSPRPSGGTTRRSTGSRTTRSACPRGTSNVFNSSRSSRTPSSSSRPATGSRDRPIPAAREEANRSAGMRRSHRSCSSWPRWPTRCVRRTRPIKGG
jgi:hypothetical protein